MKTPVSKFAFKWVNLCRYNEEEEKMEEHDKMLKRMQQRLREEEMKILRGEQQVDDNGDLDDFDMGGGGSGGGGGRGGGGRGGAGRRHAGRHVCAARGAGGHQRRRPRPAVVVGAVR